jgi:hypothetical protein
MLCRDVRWNSLTLRRNVLTPSACCLLSVSLLLKIEPVRSSTTFMNFYQATSGHMPHNYALLDIVQLNWFVTFFFSFIHFPQVFWPLASALHKTALLSAMVPSHWLTHSPRPTLTFPISTPFFPMQLTLLLWRWEQQILLKHIYQTTSSHIPENHSGLQQAVLNSKFVLLWMKQDHRKHTCTTSCPK